MLEDVRLSRNATDAIAAPENDVFVSSASIWEIAIKRAIRGLKAPDDLPELVDRSGFERLSISFEHGERAGTLPLHHRDPFDRMLVAQAQLEGLTLVTGDRKVHRYEVQTIDTRA